MGTITFKKEEMNDLENAIIVGPGSIEFTSEETDKNVRRFLIACAKDDEDERKRQTEIMRDAARIMLF